MLADTGALRKIEFLDVLFEGRSKPADEQEAFDADLALASGELGRLIPDLLEALGGVQDPAATSPGASLSAESFATEPATATTPPWV